MKWVYHTFLYNYLYPDCILVLKNPDDGHRCDANMLVKNNTTNMLMNIKAGTSRACTWLHPLTLLSHHQLWAKGSCRYIMMWISEVVPRWWDQRWSWKRCFTRQSTPWCSC